MSNEPSQLAGVDLRSGVPAGAVKEGATFIGHAAGEPVLVSRVDGRCYAIGATCSHYSGPLAEGVVVDGTVRCPWHHACFSLRTGQAVRPPALNDLPTWRVEERDGLVFVGEKVEHPVRPIRRPKRSPESVIIVGVGAAGESAAETLRREGYERSVVVIDPVSSEPIDRPNLSKDYLAGNAQAEWMPLRGGDWFTDHGIEVVRKEVRAIDVVGRRLTLSDGSERKFGALILAMGAEPIRLPLPDSGPRVFYLRTLADSDAIIAAATSGARKVVVLGASFIGLEVAASLRARGLEVHVAGPESRPLERILGPDLGDFVQSVHAEKGVVFHLGRIAKGLDSHHVVLDDGTRLAADFVVAGVGVRPRIQLAEAAGLRVDRGLMVNERLETSAPHVFAAGDIVRWPDPHSGRDIRVEHWVVAQRQGQTAARNVLGADERFDAVPFFWSAHYDVTINYVGHAERWDRIELNGDPRERDCAVRYVTDGRELAVATIFRDRESLTAELQLERVSS